MLQSNREIRDTFRVHFHDRFARCSDLLLWEFRSYLAEFPRLGEAEAPSCEGVVTECELRDALKQVGLNKSPGLDGLPRKATAHVYAHSDRCVQPLVRPGKPSLGSITKGVITLLKKGGRHVWEGLDDYRPITLLNTELKIWARVLANRLQLVISDLIGPWTDLRCEGKIDPRQIALDSRDPRGFFNF